MTRPSLALAAQVAQAVLAALALATLPAHAQAPADPSDYERSSAFTYKPNGQLETETIEPDHPALCTTTTHTYDDYGNKTSVTTAPCAQTTGAARFQPRGSTSEYPEAKNRVLAANGTTYTIDIPRGQFATRVTNALDHTETRHVDPRFGTATTVTGPNGLSTSFELDDFGRAVKEVRADGTSVDTRYCLLAAFGISDTSSNSPGCAQDITSGTRPADAPLEAAQYIHSEPRDKQGRKMGPYTRVYTDRLGRKVREVGEAFDGRLVVRDIRYNAYGAAVLTTQPYYLDSASSTSSGSADRGLTQTTYDALGRTVRVEVTDPQGQAGTVQFGELGAYRAARTTVQHHGLLTVTTDDLGRERKEEKNIEGKLARVTDATGAQLAHRHDAFGNLVQTQDALQNLLKITYDIRGRKLSVDDPDTGLWTYCYNALGELKAQQSPNQRGSTAAVAQPAQPCPATGEGLTAEQITGWTTLAYDKLGRLVDRQEAEYRSSWSYDKYADGSACAQGIGKLCETRTGHGVVRQHEYDSLGRPQASRSTMSNGPSLASAVSYDDDTGRVSARRYPTGVAVNYAYNTRGYLDSVSLATAATLSARPASPGGTPGASVQWPAGKLLWQAGTYNAWGAPETETLGNDVTVRAEYEAATGRVTEARTGAGAATNVLYHVYRWDSAGNLAARSDGNGEGGGVSETFQYDAVNRLTQYSVDAPLVENQRRTVDLVYNAIGNLLRKSDVGNYEYGPSGNDGGATRPRPHAVARVTGSLLRSYTYDANGNVTGASGSKYTQIRYTSFNLPDSQGGVGGGAASYTWRYDENHQRVEERRSSAAGTRTTWFYHPDNAGGLSFEREEAANGGLEHRHYVSAGSQTLVLVSTAALPEGTGRAPAQISQIDLVKVEYWHRDHLGSLAATSDHNGAVTARYAYDPFGKRRMTSGRYDANGALVIDWDRTDHGTDRGFTGHEHLDDVGLIHMNGRLYDPLIGRFLQGDPLVQAPDELQNYNRYSYCFNNPLNCTDPTGYWSLKKFIKKAVRAFFVPTMKNTIEAFAAQPGQEQIDRLIMRNQFLYQAGMIVASVYGGPYGAAMYSSYYTARSTGSMNAAFRAGVTSLASAALNTWAGDMGAQYGMAAHYAAHMAVGCVQHEVGGGKCGQGMFSAAITLELTPLISSYTEDNPILGAMGAAVIGGTASVIGGGKFANGAQTGAFQYLFNYLMHLTAAPAKVARGMPVLMYVDDKAHTQFTGFLMDLQDWGINVKVTDAFRTNGMQALLSGNAYGGAAYGRSLHEAGFAIDINWNSLTLDQQKFTLERAKAWGLKWGGGFKPYDPVHFYVDPFKNRQQRIQAIRDAQQEFMEGR